MSANIAIGIAIEGIPGASDPTLIRCLAYGDTLPTSSTYEWEHGLVEIPADFSSTSVDPFEGTWSTSSTTFKVSASDTLAGLLLREDRFPLNALNGALTTSATSVTLDSTASGTVLFAGDETMLITAGSNPYTVTRGALGSTVQAHDDNAYVGEHPAYWVPREISVVYYDLTTDEEWVEWRGYIDDVLMEGPVISLPCTEFYQRWSQASANIGAVDLNAQGGWRRKYGTRVVGGYAGASTIRTSTGNVALQMGDTICIGQWVSSGRFVGDFNAGSPIYGGELDLNEAGQDVFPHAVYEVLLWDRDLDIAPITGTDRFHPLRIVMELLTGENLDAQWSVSLGIDTTLIQAEIDANPGLQIDHLALGINGESYNPFEVAERIARLYGYSPSITVNGDYTFKRLKVLDISAYQDAQDNTISVYRDLPLSRTSSKASGASSIKVEVGGVVPWRTPDGVRVDAVGGSRRALLLTDREKVSYDASTIKRDRTVEIATQLADSVVMIHYGMPRLTVRVVDHRVTGADYDLLGTVQLSDLGTLVTAWWTDAQGNRVANVSGRIDAVGVVIERRLNGANRTYDLTLLLIAFGRGQYARERAPSAEVKSVATDEVTVDNAIHAGEASYFTIGDEVQFWNRDGSQADATVYTVTGIAGDVLQIVGHAASAGEIVRLAVSTSYANSTRYSVTDRPYTYFADANDEIARSGDTDDADIYGGGLGVSY
jgi:hypothetical protein